MKYQTNAPLDSISGGSAESLDRTGQVPHQDESDKAITLVLPRSQLLTVNKLLHGIGIQSVSVREMDLPSSSQLRGRNQTSLAASDSERLFRLQFLANPRLARKAVRILSTFLRMQYLRSGERAVTEINHIIQVTAAD